MMLREFFMNSDGYFRKLSTPEFGKWWNSILHIAIIEFMRLRKTPIIIELESA